MLAKSDRVMDRVGYLFQLECITVCYWIQPFIDFICSIDYRFAVTIIQIHILFVTLTFLDSEKRLEFREALNCVNCKTTQKDVETLLTTEIFFYTFLNQVFQYFEMCWIFLWAMIKNKYQNYSI